MTATRAQLIAGARRFVVKVGSAVLAGGAQGARLDLSAVRRLARDIAAARRRGLEPLLVTSGAILAGVERLGLKSRPSTTQGKQAAAAVGQSRLMRAWEAAFSREGLVAAQVLLTREDVRNRERYLNARNTLFELLRLKAVPVINENDTVAVEEIQFGDNDVLSALVASLADAQLLVLLTDQEGLYDADPRRAPAARIIRVVAAGDASAELDEARPGPWGSGGMGSKDRAARIAAASGIPALIASGLKAGVLEAALKGEEVGTLFMPGERLAKRRHWLAFAAGAEGAVEVDAGARDAIVSRAKSLLPSGVRSITGSFEAGAVVSLVVAGVEFARGLANYGHRELERIKGLKTSQIQAALGYKTADEVVHRDNLAVLPARQARGS